MGEKKELSPKGKGIKFCTLGIVWIYPFIHLLTTLILVVRKIKRGDGLSGSLKISKIWLLPQGTYNLMENIRP